MTGRKKILLIIIIFTLAFIWGQSMIPEDLSSRESGFVGMLVKPVLEIFAGRGNVTDFLVRKLAHFTEYAVLGLEIAAFGHGISPLFVFTGPSVAVIDEMLIQRLSGRGSMWTDVLIDSCGFLLLFLITNLFFFLHRKKDSCKIAP